VNAIRMICRSLLTDQKGATAIEYGLIVALIGVAIVGAASKLGGGSNGMWTTIADRYTNATGH
jgi:pilus assembly protein Flp/PilA